MVSVLFAFASSFANALNVVTQHVASTAAPAREKGWRLAVYLVRSPLWLFGVAAMIGAFLFQAIALDKGQLSVVQSILVTELVFSLVLGRLWLRRHVVGAAWVSACLTSAGLAVFLVMSEPKGGHTEQPQRAADQVPRQAPALNRRRRGGAGHVLGDEVERVRKG